MAFVKTEVQGAVEIITIDRPKACLLYTSTPALCSCPEHKAGVLLCKLEFFTSSS